MSVSSHTFTVHWCLSASKTTEVTQNLKVVIVHQMKRGKTRRTRCADVVRVSKNKQLHYFVFKI